MQTATYYLCVIGIPGPEGILEGPLELTKKEAKQKNRIQNTVGNEWRIETPKPHTQR
jgi:hypothetical protein